jgi:hypothetical protein
MAGLEADPIPLLADIFLPTGAGAARRRRAS